MDLDGTLIATDLLWESLASAMRRNVFTPLALPFWLVRGRPVLKQRLAELADIDFATLPYRAEVVAFVGEARRLGNRVVLATASDSRLANRVAQHLGVFHEVLASDGHVNLKGRAKADVLVRRFGERGFDYIGDSHADVPCWASAADAITVGVLPARQVPHLRRLAPAPGAARAEHGRFLLRALRPHQWMKNLLLFVPMLGAHRFEVETMVAAVVAFASLSLAASGGYVFNDLLDLSADRRHWRKKLRPFAAGHLSVRTGLLLVTASWIIAFSLASTLGWHFSALVGAYLAGTTAYSLRLKRMPVLDVLFLAGLYVMRVVGGGWATDVPVSSWLLAFTLFICLSLAFLKRFIEVRALDAGSTEIVAGRGYVAEDSGWLASAGLAASYLSALVLALYVNNPDVTRLYTSPDRLLLICPLLLYGTTKIWWLAHRRELHDDPVVAVVADPATYLLLALGALAVLLAL